MCLVGWGSEDEGRRAKNNFSEIKKNHLKNLLLEEPEKEVFEFINVIISNEK